jgi:hypothetical protein
LMVARGYASLSFLHSAAEYIHDLDVPFGTNSGPSRGEPRRRYPPRCGSSEFL